MANDDDTPKYGWGPGFVRGFELGVIRTANALRNAMIDAKFTENGWTREDIEDFVQAVIKRANEIRP